jgi:hypothetical protein
VLVWRRGRAAAARDWRERVLAYTSRPPHEFVFYSSLFHFNSPEMTRRVRFAVMGVDYKEANGSPHTRMGRFLGYRETRKGLARQTQRGINGRAASSGSAIFLI